MSSPNSAPPLTPRGPGGSTQGLLAAAGHSGQLQRRRPLHRQLRPRPGVRGQPDL